MSAMAGDTLTRRQKLKKFAKKFKSDPSKVMHLVAAVLHAASTIVLKQVSVTVPVRETLGVRQRWNPVNSSVTCADEACIAEAYIRRVAEVDLLELGVAFGAVTAASHVLQLGIPLQIMWGNRGTAYNPIRWAEYSITAPLMFIVISVVCGILEDNLLWVSATSMWGVMFVGGVAESLYNNVNKGGYKRSPQGLALFAVQFAVFVTLWVPIFSSLRDVGRDEYAVSEMPDVVYLIVGVMCAVYSSFAAAFFVCTVLGRGSWIMSEVVYTSLSLTSKILLHWLVWYAVFSQSTMVKQESGAPVSDTSNLKTAGAIAGGAVLLGVVFAGYFWHVAVKTP